MQGLGKIFALLLGAIVGTGAVAQAQMYPALYDVTDVPAGNVLNIRIEPKEQTNVVGQFPPDAEALEITALDTSGKWGRVNVSETSGWVWMEYMTRQPDQDFTEPRRCFGVEPFWSLTFEPEGGTYTVLGDTGRPFPQMSRVGSTAGPNRMGYVLNDGATALIAVVARTECTDGMSDRSYGFAVDLLEMGGRNNRRLHSGCCAIATR